jgi:hypothetical protein
LKRTLTSIAAASMVLGTLVPVAFASTNSLSWSKDTIAAGTYSASPEGFAGSDAGSTTTFIPVYYVSKALTALGYTVNWDGNAHVLSVTTPSGVKASTSGISVGTGNTSIYVNGQLVKKVNSQAQKDPASGPKGQATTYFPIFYVNQLLTAAGVGNTWNGNGWTLTAPTVSSTTGAGLSVITVTKSSSGDGSISNPAVALSGSSLTLSTTLTDANGNTLPSTAVTFNVSEYGQYPGQLPSVENASGTLISGSKQSNYEQYTVYTDSTGVATISVTGPSGQTFGYEVQAVAPYVNGNSAAVSSQPVYAEFVSGNNVGFTPGGNGTYDAAVGASVPITLTLPVNPTTNKPYSNVGIQLTASGTAQFVNATGGTLGNTIDVATNSSGIAQALLTNGTAQDVTVSAVLPSGLGLANPSNLSISFGQTGVPSQILNYSVSAANNTAQIGQNIVVSGQLADAQGNPVANGQILVTAMNNGPHNDFAYVSGTTTTAFPLVAESSVVTGTPANSSVGDVVTADANGSFSLSLTDTYNDSNETYYVWPVANGEVTNETSGAQNPLNGSNNTVSFTPSTSVAEISIGGIESVVQGNSDTSITGLSAQANAGGSNPAIGADAGTNSQITDVYVEPQNASGHHDITALNATQLTYQLSANNGGLIYAINGTPLTSPVGSVTLTYNGNGTFTANGQNIGSLSAATLAGKSATANADDFEVGVTNANEGATTLTVTSNAQTATAAINFAGQVPDQVASFTPASGNVTAGSNLQVKFNVQDVNGNAVGQGTAVNIYTDNGSSDPFWVTQVNGATLSASINTSGNGLQPSYTTDNTPVPLGSNAGVNYTVSQSGVALWTPSSNYFTTYTDASGNVTLTLQAGGLSYPVPGTANLTNVTPMSGSAYVYTNTNGYSESVLFSTSTSIPSGFNEEVGYLNSTGGVVAPLSAITLSTSSVTGSGSVSVATNSNATGGVYTLTGPAGYSGVTINSSTGAVTVTNGTVGTYAVTYAVNGAQTTPVSFTVAAAATGVTYTAPYAAYTPAVTAVQGTNALTLSGSVTAGGTITVVSPTASDSQTLNVNTSDNASTVANEIAVAFGGDTIYNVTASGSVVTFTQKTATTAALAASSLTLVGATGSLVGTAGAVTNGVTGVAAVPGVDTVNITNGATSAAGTLTVTVNGTVVSVPVVAGASANTVAGDIFVALSNNATLSSNFTFVYTGGTSLTITQKVASSATITTTITV